MLRTRVTIFLGVKPEHIQAFVNRPRQPVESLKAEWWASHADADVLAALDLSCAATGVSWYLFGAQAALLYGSARLTANVDATVLLGDVSTEALVAALEARGFELKINDPEFVAATRVITARRC